VNVSATFVKPPADHIEAKAQLGADLRVREQAEPLVPPDASRSMKTPIASDHFASADEERSEGAGVANRRMTRVMSIARRLPAAPERATSPVAGSSSAARISPGRHVIRTIWI